jgi:hypothetical protein
LKSSEVSTRVGVVMSLQCPARPRWAQAVVDL